MLHVVIQRKWPRNSPYLCSINSLVLPPVIYIQMKKLFLFTVLAVLIWACAKKSGDAPATAADGAKIYKQYCVLCHGADGKLGINSAKDLSVSTLTEQERIVMVTEGKNAMTPFKGVLTPEEIKAVVAYTFTLKP
jgi:mono/diheme cytochrome c family protein